MYRVAICDDNKEYLEQVEQIVRKFEEQSNYDIALKIFSDSDLLKEYVEE